MGGLLTFIAGLPATAWSILTRPHPPLPSVKPPLAKDVTALVAQTLLANTIAIGPLPRTGGQIHEIDEPTASAVATQIVESAAAYKLKVSLVTSYVIQESRGDPRAINPNNQNAKPGETAFQKFLHTDYGVAQIDGETLVGMPDLAGKTTDELIALAYDITWAIPRMCAIIAANFASVAKRLAADPQLEQECPDGDVRVAQTNAYNAGVEGTFDALEAHGSLAYGIEVVERADSLVSLLDI